MRVVSHQFYYLKLFSHNAAVKSYLFTDNAQRTFHTVMNVSSRFIFSFSTVARMNVLGLYACFVCVMHRS